MRPRAWIVGLVAGLTSLCLIVKAVADQTLGARPMDLGPLDLRLAFNPGVAFSLGNQLPSAVIVAVTSAITLGLLTLAWRTAASLTTFGVVGFASVLAGAVSNIIDRAADGLVTDYFHTGWYPTFNLPDVLITTGAGLIVLGTTLPHETRRSIRRRQKPA